MLAEEAGEFDAFVSGPALLNPVGGGDADEERQMGWPYGANGVHHFQQQAGAIAKAAAEGVRAPVGQWRKKLVEQIAVRGVNLNKVKMRGQGPMRGLSKGLRNGRKSVGGLKAWAGSIPGQKPGRWAPRLASHLSAGSNRRSPVNGTDLLPLRPAWASWMPARTPWEWRKLTIRLSPGMCSSFQMPRSPGEMRPSGTTAAASMTTRPAPPWARLPRCTKCQSLAKPSCAEYWHMGEDSNAVGKGDRAKLKLRKKEGGTCR